MFCRWQKAGLWRAYSGTTPSAVQLSHQVPVRRACGEVLVALGEFGAEVEDPLLQLADPAGECFDVGGGTEPGGFPDGLSERFGQASFEPGDVRGETAVAGRAVRDVGQQRLAADLGPAVAPGGGSAARARTTACRSPWR